ncbi:MAG: hypothetical protein ABH879_01185 [archaeon]
MEWKSLIVGILVGFVGTLLGAYLQYLISIKTSRANRRADHRFKKCDALWSALVDLKQKGNELWKVANRENLMNYSASLKNLILVIEMNRLLLSESEYDSLRPILRRFEIYRFGKQSLMDLRGTDRIFPHKVNIEMMIEKNEFYKQQYEQIMNDILRKFRSQIS